MKKVGNLLIEILVRRGDIDAGLRDRLGRKSGPEICAELVEQGVVASSRIAEAIAELLAIPYASLREFEPDKQLFDLISVESAEKLGAIPFADDGKTACFVVADPFDPMLAERLKHACRLRRKISMAVADRLDVERLLKKLASTDKLRASARNEQASSQQVKGDEAARSPVIQFINTLLATAINSRASDIHIETRDQNTNVRYRIDGVLYPAKMDVGKGNHAALVSRLKVMAELDLAEKRLPQDGRFNQTVDGREIDFRVSILPSVHGEDVVIRILDKSAIAKSVGKLSLEALGFSPTVLKSLRKAVREPYGMILITGPTGSGKTTTLYGALSEYDVDEEKIVTIEDPVEYQLPGILQVAVNEKKNLTFAKGLRSILRHDPDKVMVGEIRDSETAQIAVQSALTGHLVFSTVHANNAIDVMNRFSHMGLNVYNVVSALNCVVAQRLLRKICEACKRPVQVGREELEVAGLDYEKYGNVTWYEGAGCMRCGDTGYFGRSAVAEFLQMTSRIRDMMVNRSSVAELELAAVEEGMVTLRKAALEKAISGVTTIREVNRVTFS